MKKNIYFYTNLLAWGLVLFLIGNYAFGWTTPSVAPPDDNLPAPINEGSDPQTKSGNLTIGGNLITGGLQMTTGAGADKVLTTDASGIASWQTPAGGSLWTQTGDDIYYNTGSVGIGTTGPTDSLYIMTDEVGVASDVHAITVNAYRPHLNLVDRSGFGVANGHNYQILADLGKFWIKDDPANDGTYTDTRFVIDNVGNVGIGTTGPGAKLHITTSGEGIRIDRTSGQESIKAGSADGYMMIDSAGQVLGLNWYVTDNVVLAQGGGNVGIGTTSPAAKLHVAGDVFSSGFWAAGNNASFGFHKDPTGYTHHMAIAGSSDSGTQRYIYFGYYPSDNRTNDFVPKVSINSYSGNVGIGDTTPTYKLDVAGTGRFTGALSATTLDTGQGANELYDMNQNVMTSNRPTFIGANFTTSNGDAYATFYQSSEASYWAIGLEDGNAPMPQEAFVISRASTLDAGPKLTILEGGNVGIGTTAPGYKLDVAGTGRFTSNLTGLGFFYSSDESLKENVQKIETPLAKIMKLDGISFNWKESGKKSMGLIAQDVEKVFPEIVNTEEETGLKSVEYAKLVAPLIEAVKEQQKMIDEQKELINQQGEEIKILKALFE